MRRAPVRGRGDPDRSHGTARIARASEAGHLTCTVQLFRIAPALHLVDWRRENGDVRAYHAFYTEQRALLGDLVAPG